MKSHELTVKAMQQAQDIGPYNAISRALQEYGESVRQQAVSVCMETWRNAPNDRASGYRQNMISHGCKDCAAAIEKMEIK